MTLAVAKTTKFRAPEVRQRVKVVMNKNARELHNLTEEPKPTYSGKSTDVRALNTSFFNFKMDQSKSKIENYKSNNRFGALNLKISDHES